MAAGRIIAFICLAGVAMSPLAAVPGDMSAATFLAKVDGLKAKGPLALFSSDIGLLKSEARAAGLAYGARLKREEAAGKPSSCPPNPVKISPSMFLDHLRSYPVSRRPAISLNTAMADLFIAKFPCRK